MKTAIAILFCAALAVHAATAAEPAPHADAPAAPQSGHGQPATEIVGFISPMQGAGICMDGATHLVHSVQGDFRLKAANPQAAKDLEQVANGKDRVSLVGHRVTGPECVYFSVERVTRMVHT